MAQAVHARIQGAELAVIENAGGYFLIEQPERFLEVAGPFLERVAGDASR
jgi:pimeloyl-ACP methyl ester carboxylesterase